jgi:hypothetical protein
MDSRATRLAGRLGHDFKRQELRNLGRIEVVVRYEHETVMPVREMRPPGKALEVVDPLQASLIEIEHEYFGYRDVVRTDQTGDAFDVAGASRIRFV